MGVEPPAPPVTVNRGGRARRLRKTSRAWWGEVEVLPRSTGQGDAAPAFSEKVIDPVESARSVCAGRITIVNGTLPVAGTFESVAVMAS